MQKVAVALGVILVLGGLAFVLGLFDAPEESNSPAPALRGREVTEAAASPKEPIGPEAPPIETTGFVAPPSGTEPEAELPLDEAKPVEISGEVVTADGPLAGATVELFENRALVPQQVQVGALLGVVVSDASGRFRFEVALPSPSLILQARHENFAAERIQKLDPTDPAQRRPRLFLKAGHPLSGGVFHQDGRPLPDVTVKIFDLNIQAFDPEHRLERATRTDAQGQWVVQGLLAGTKMVEASAPGFTTRQLPLVAVPRAAEGLRITLQDGFSIEGRVVHLGSGAPAVGARILARPYNEPGAPRDTSRPVTYTATTDDQGVFVLAGLVEAELELTAFGAGFVRGSGTRVRSGTRGVVLEVPAPVSLAGRVLTRGDAEPVSNFTIRIETNPLLTTPGAPSLRISDPEGRFRFEGAPAWPVAHLVVEARGRPRATLGPINFSTGEVFENLIVEMPRGAIARGKVVDDQSRPAAGVEVQAELTQQLGDPSNAAAAFMAPMLNAAKMRRRAKTDVDGQFVFTGLEAGEWTFRVRSDHWFSPRPEKLNLGPDDEGNLPVLTLSAGGTLLVRIRTKADAPDAAASVRLIGVSEPRFSEELNSDAEGRVRFVGLLPGDYRVQVMRREGVVDLGAIIGSGNASPGAEPQRSTIQIRASQETAIDL